MVQQPGLVGGHCIGVDPYYLTHKARQVGFEPNIILAGRGVNDGMAAFVAGKVTGLIEVAGGAVNDARVLVMGLTFKENCPDTRNSQVYRLIEVLQGQGCVVDVMDPWVSELLENNTASGSTAMPENVELIKRPVPGTYQAVISAVAHRQFDAFSVEQMASWGSEHCVFYDIKNRLSDELVTGRL